MLKNMIMINKGGYSIMEYGAATSSLVSSLSGLGGEVTSMLGDVAPEAIKVMGIFLIWRLGIRFFKSFAKA